MVKGVKKLPRLMQTVSSGTGIWFQEVWLQSPHSTGSPSCSFSLRVDLWSRQISRKITFFIFQNPCISTQMWPQNDLGYLRDNSKALFWGRGRATVDRYCTYRWNNLLSIIYLKFPMLQPSEVQPYMHTCVINDECISFKQLIILDMPIHWTLSQ